jgi:hypothetical protein
LQDQERQAQASILLSHAAMMIPNDCRDDIRRRPGDACNDSFDCSNGSMYAARPLDDESRPDQLLAPDRR